MCRVAVALSQAPTVSDEHEVGLTGVEAGREEFFPGEIAEADIAVFVGDASRFFERGDFRGAVFEQLRLFQQSRDRSGVVGHGNLGGRRVGNQMWYMISACISIRLFTPFTLCCGLSKTTTEYGATDFVSQTFDPITELSPMTVRPPRIVALA